MALNFPNNPTAGVTTYISDNTTWLWDGIAWNVVSTDPALSQNVFYVSPDGADSGDFDGRRIDTAWLTIGYALSQVPEESTVLVSNGTYQEQLPLRVPKNVAVIGESMRTTIVTPAAGLDRNGNPNNTSTMWLLNDGSLLKNMTFDGLTGFTTGVNPANVDEYTAQGVFVALDPADPVLIKSPYVVECSAFSTGGVGAVVDGSVHTSGNKSILFHGYTNLHDLGVGFWVKNGGKSEVVSCFTYYCHVGYLTTSGGQIRALNGNCSYGLYGAFSSGFDPTETPITGTLLGNQLTWDPLTLVGSFADGDTIIGATSGAIGLVTEVQLSSDKLYYTTVSGVFQNGEVIELADESASAQLLAEDGVTGQNGFILVVTGLTAPPIPGTSVSFTGTGVDTGSYVVRAVSGTYVNTSSTIILALANEKVVPSAGGTALVVRRAFSQTRLTGHDFLNIGTGGVTTTNYPNIPTQPPSQGNEIIEQQQGRVYYVSTDQDGNFRVGAFFRVNQATGVATLNASAFDLSGLNSLRLGAVGAQLGELINEFSSDATLSSNSNEKVPTEAAVRGYFENIRTNVLPGEDSTYDLGSTTNKWRDTWVEQLRVVANTTTDAVRITQTGTGNCFVVEDSASPDASPFVIDNQGRIGIGTNSPIAKLHVAGDVTIEGVLNVANPVVTQTDIGTAPNEIPLNQYLGNLAYQDAANIAGPVRVGVGASSPFVIDSAGNVGIGSTNPTSPLTIQNNNLGTTAGDVKHLIRTSTTASNGDFLLISKYRISNGPDWQTAGTRIQQLVDLTYHAYMQFNGNNNEGISFGTGGNANPLSVVERMRIDSAGALILAGSTAQKATGTTWSNPSDVRLKDNIRDYTKGVEDIMQVQVREWEYNGKGGTVEGTYGLGVIADEIMQVLPNTVENYEAKLNADDEENTAIKKFDATEITWLLVKSVQELKAELDVVKAELNTLKGN